MTGPPLPVSGGHASARREFSGSDGGHPSDEVWAPQSRGAARALHGRDGRSGPRRKALETTVGGFGSLAGVVACRRGRRTRSAHRVAAARLTDTSLPWVLHAG